MQLLLLAIIIYQNYQEELHSFKDKIQKEMKICSLDLQCKNLSLDFVPITKNIKLNKLYKNGTFYTFYKVPTSSEYYLKVYLPQKIYEKKLTKIKQKLFFKFLFYAFLIALFSFLFSLYTLYPLKKALTLNEEFMKDILHDINTPLSSIVINFKMLQKELKENKKIDRILQSIEKIVHLQKNIKSSLDNSLLQKEHFDLKDLLEKEISYFQKEYPNLTFEKSLKSVVIYSNKDALKRIVYNILSNACKYNKGNGKVTVTLKENELIIADTGIGIKNPNKIFERYYKESARGLGIGMHIVKKLSQQLKINMQVKSKINEGTTFILSLKKVINE